jgi:hypothetical protein
MQTNYPELRAWLNQIDYFPTMMRKSAYMCTIQDNQALTVPQLLEANNLIQPSMLIVVMPDGSYKDFWQECADDPQTTPYEYRLVAYSASFFVC